VAQVKCIRSITQTVALLLVVEYVSGVKLILFVFQFGFHLGVSARLATRPVLTEHHAHLRKVFLEGINLLLEKVLLFGGQHSCFGLAFLFGFFARQFLLNTITQRIAV
jgi:hypothetical protein